jgi:V/A-type H+/Na+-transporting ATPase subunit E
MENKLQELTNKIYTEGIDRANKEAEAILAGAKAEAENLQKQAEKNAALIVEQAEKEAREIKNNVQSEVRLSARQAISTIKQKITDLITARSTGTEIKKALDDKEFLQKIILTAIKNWDPKSAQGIDVAILLPESDRKELDEYFSVKQKALLEGGLILNFDDSMESGFKIGPKDGSFVISFTDQDFESFFRHYLRPRTTELLYSDK